jgi:D-alanine transaminase
LIDSLDIPFAGAHVTLNELKAADELILVATTTEVLPVIELDGAPIGSGKPGPITQRLHRAYEAAVGDWLAEEARVRPAASPVLGG